MYEILHKKHDKDHEMLEIFSYLDSHERKLTAVWAVVHRDFIDDTWMNNLLSEGNAVEFSISLEGILDA